MSSEEMSLRESRAFREYHQGRSKKIKKPWVTIVLVAIFTAGFSIVTSVLAVWKIPGNPWWSNLLISLYGIPAGFIVAWRNKQESLFDDLKAVTLCALIYAGAYVLISLLLFVIPTMGVSALYSIGGLIMVCGFIALYSICFPFPFGAFLANALQSIKDSR